MSGRVASFRAPTVMVGLAFSVSCSSANRTAHECDLAVLSGSWSVEMASVDSTVTVTGSLDFASKGGRVQLVSETSEGTREPGDFPITSLRVAGDSLSFSFAPAGFALRGRCVSPDSIAGRFALPNSPHDSIHGTWWARRMTRR